MRFSSILGASLLAPLIAAHGDVPGAPKIFGLPARDVVAMKSRNILEGRAARAARSAPGSKLGARQGGLDGRCGKDFGCATCAEGYCCSSSGYCGQGKDYCQAPDSLFDYGPAADANVLPSGGTTKNIARPKNGNVLYGGDGIWVCTKPGQIAITYDDGPYIYTSDLLDLFASYNFKATFFITGINLSKGSIDSSSQPWAAVIARMAAEGHQIASHTWSHQDLSAITKAQRYEQMVKLEMALSNIVGKFPTYMRPPYSSCTAASGCVQDMADLGYHISYFDLDTDDYNNVVPEKAQIPKDNIKAALDSRNAATDEFLAIAHDIHFQTVYNMTAYMLDLMVTKGYKGVTMGECLGDPEANWYRSPAGRVATSSVFTPPACASTRASSASSSGTKTSSAAVSTPTAVSTDSSCGPASGFTCLGFSEGECCSQYNYCGNTEGHCGTGCQAGFGKCGLSSSSSLLASTSSRASSSKAASSSSTKVSSASVASTKISSSSSKATSTVKSSSVASSSVKTSSVASSTKVSSTIVGSSTRVSSSSAPSSTANQVTSPDATCGGTKGYTCIGSSEGECCSQYGWCGSSTGHCGTGCNPLFGKCTSSGTSSSVKAVSSSATKAPSSTPQAASSTSKASSSPAVVPSSTKPVSSSTKPASFTKAASSSTKASSTPIVRSSSTKPASSIVAASSTRASSASGSKPTGIISPNGSCGSANKGYHCIGYYEGECCSQYGWCGSSTGHCGTKCQSLYGKCT